MSIGMFFRAGSREEREKRRVRIQERKTECEFGGMKYQRR